MNNIIKNITILKGGWNSEREISLISARSVSKAVKELGYNVKEVDVKRDLTDLIKNLTPKPDLVINILHGKWGEDGRIQSILDILEIPYAFSNHISSAIAMDKTVTRDILKAHNLPIPKGFELNFADIYISKQPIEYPFVIKPPCEGSSFGVSIILNKDDFENALKNWKFGKRVLIEEYIPGKELSTAVIGGTAIGTIELNPKNGFYDYEKKYTDGLTEHIMPANINKNDYEETIHLAEKSYLAIKCDGICRVDFRYNINDKENPIRILEINTQPGLTPLSILPEIASYNGISFNDIVKWMIENSKCHE